MTDEPILRQHHELEGNAFSFKGAANLKGPRGAAGRLVTSHFSTTGHFPTFSIVWPEILASTLELSEYYFSADFVRLEEETVCWIKYC
jgi:hypothetical protein